MLHENSADESSNGLVECDWWSGHDINQFFQKYYHQGKTTLQAFFKE
jgi:hypothetical protein